MRRLLSYVALSFALALPVHAGPLADGFAALKRGDFVKAIDIWRPLAEKGDPKAQFALGIMYDRSYEYLRDHTKAAKWYRKSAEQGNASAQHNLGVLYDKGYGVPKDHAEAVKWYRKAAEQGRAAAQHKLGGKYERGQGVPQDEIQAYMWYSLAMDKKHEAAFQDRKLIIPLMSDGDITKAKRLVKKWRADHAKK